MLTRSAFRGAASSCQQLRRYATEPLTPKSSPNYNNNNKPLLYAAGAGLIASGSLYLYSTNSNTSSKVADQAKTQVQHAAHKMAGAAPKKALTGGDQGFVSVLLDNVQTVNHNTKRLRFKLPEDDMVSGLSVASAVLTKFQPAGSDAPTLRPYTPISDEDTQGYMDLLIKKYPNGAMSTHLHDMTPGQRLDIKGPLPKYSWTPNKHDHIGLIAGGTGITPMYQLCRAIFKNPEDRTQVTLVVGNITEADILLKKELAELENTYPQRFRAFYVLDTPPSGWTGARGYITKDLLKTVLPPAQDANIKVFVCGPPGMVNSISGNKVSPQDQGELVGALKELGYTKDQVYKF